MLSPLFCASMPVTFDGKLKTDVVVAVLNVTVVFSLPLNDARFDATAVFVTNSLAFVFSALTPLSISSRDSPPSLKKLSIIASFDLAPVRSLSTLKTVDVLAFGFTNEMRLSS